MLNDELFEKISEIFQIIKKSKLPFGGIQIILVGDLFQLSPITGNYCFLSKHWDECNIKPFLLKTNMRQKDLDFQQLLERLRYGRCSDDDYNTLVKLKKTKFPDNIIPTKLYSKNIDVDSINNKELAKLLTDQFNEFGEEIRPRTYTIRFVSNNIEHKKFAKNWAVNISKIQEKLELCLNAQVMLTYNINIKAGLVNGARGYITGFLNDTVRVKFINGLEIFIEYISRKMTNNDEIEISYIPLKLAWAISIHKSQGMTIDALEVDLGNSIFANGQAYTALSRARNMNSVKITNLLKSSFKASPAVVAFYADL
jgi:ATP-dependent DNA helicase PIF1